MKTSAVNAINPSQTDGEKMLLARKNLNDSFGTISHNIVAFSQKHSKIFVAPLVANMLHRKSPNIEKHEKT